MSKPETPTTDAAPDPHGILTDTPFDSIREAEREADSATDARAQPRCNQCASTNVSVKPGATSDDPDHKIDAQYRCVACGEHQDELAPSVESEGVPRHATDGGCGRALHVRQVGAGTYRCHRCDATWWSLEGFGE